MLALAVAVDTKTRRKLKSNCGEIKTSALWLSPLELSLSTRKATHASPLVLLLDIMMLDALVVIFTSIGECEIPN